MAKLLYRYDVKLRHKVTGVVGKSTHRLVAPNIKTLKSKWSNPSYDIHSVKKVGNTGFKPVGY